MKKDTKESGNIVILFAISFVIIVTFVALSTDVVLAFNQRNRLREVGTLIHEARFDLGEELWNSEDPRLTLLEVAQEIAVRNGLNYRQVNVVWHNQDKNANSRMAIMEVILTDTYNTTTLKILGIKKLPITVVLKGSQDKASGLPVWRPGW